jgi:hypothetical protein
MVLTPSQPQVISPAAVTEPIVDPWFCYFRCLTIVGDSSSCIRRCFRI